MQDLRMKQVMNRYGHGRYRGGNKVSRELFFSDFAKFSELREKLFCEKSRILSDRESKFSQKIFAIFFLYTAFLNVFLVVFRKKTTKKN